MLSIASVCACYSTIRTTSLPFLLPEMHIISYSLHMILIVQYLIMTCGTIGKLVITVPSRSLKYSVCLFEGRGFYLFNPKVSKFDFGIITRYVIRL
jgi:hypothetical protein